MIERSYQDDKNWKPNIIIIFFLLEDEFNVDRITCPSSSIVFADLVVCLDWASTKVVLFIVAYIDWTYKSDVAWKDHIKMIKTGTLAGKNQSGAFSPP